THTHTHKHTHTHTHTHAHTHTHTHTHTHKHTHTHTHTHTNTHTHTHTHTHPHTAAHTHKLTSSMRSLALPISSGMDTSLLLLTTRTRSGRLNRYFGSVDRRFRLGDNKTLINQPSRRSNTQLQHTT